MILRLKEVRKDRSGRTRVVVGRTADDELLHGRIDKRSGAFYLESEHLVFGFPAHEALVVWELLKQAFDGKFLEATSERGPRHGAPRQRQGQTRRGDAKPTGGPRRAAGADANHTAG
jgi:hypothetical protein